MASLTLSIPIDEWCEYGFQLQMVKILRVVVVHDILQAFFILVDTEKVRNAREA